MPEALLYSRKYYMHSRILLSNTATGETLPAAPASAVLLSCNGVWKGIKIEHHLLTPGELPEHLVNDHRLMINTRSAVSFEHKTDGRWKPYIYRRGDFALLSHHEMNHPRWHDTLDIIAIAIDPTHFNALAERERINFNIHAGKADPFLLQIAEQLLREIRQESLAGRLYGESLATAFMIHLVSRYERDKKPVFAPKGKLSAAQLKNVIDYSHSCLHKNIGLDELAGQAHLSGFHFSRLFRNSLGISPHQFMLQLKLDNAKKLIRQRKYSLTEIAYQLGFNDQAHFSNAFKKATGLSPRRFLQS